MDEKELLKYAVDSGILDIALVQKQANMQKRKEILSKHPYNIWQGKDGYWRTYIPKEFGRKLIKKKNKEDLETVIIDYIESDKKDTFKERFFIWVERQKICGRSDNTVAKYESDYRRFFKGDEIEDMPLRQITDGKIAEYINRLLKRKDIPYRAFKVMIGYLNAVFEKSIKDKVVDDNPCKYIDVPIYRKGCKESKIKTAEERTLSVEERKALLQKLSDTAKDCKSYIASYAVELSLFTGMRVGELAGLMWKDIDFQNRTITIQRSEKYNRKTHEFYISGTKNNLVRVIPLTGDMEKILRKTMEEEKRLGFLGKFVFCNEDGRIHTRMISQCVRTKTETKEFVNEKSIHAIRRTLNSNLRCNGVPATVAAALLGHTEEVNEKNYTYDVSSMSKKAEVIQLAGKIS